MSRYCPAKLLLLFASMVLVLIVQLPASAEDIIDQSDTTIETTTTTVPTIETTVPTSTPETVPVESEQPVPETVETTPEEPTLPHDDVSQVTEPDTAPPDEEQPVLVTADEAELTTSSQPKTSGINNTDSDVKTKVVLPPQSNQAKCCIEKKVQSRQIESKPSRASTYRVRLITSSPETAIQGWVSKVSENKVGLTFPMYASADEENTAIPALAALIVLVLLIKPLLFRKPA